MSERDWIKIWNTSYWRCGEAMKGESYQKFMPWQQADFDEKARHLEWWQWPLFFIMFVGLVVFYAFYKLYEWIRYRGRSDFVPGSAKHNYRVKPERKDE